MQLYSESSLELKKHVLLVKWKNGQTWVWLLLMFPFVWILCFAPSQVWLKQTKWNAFPRIAFIFYPVIGLRVHRSTTVVLFVNICDNRVCLQLKVYLT